MFRQSRFNPGHDGLCTVLWSVNTLVCYSPRLLFTLVKCVCVGGGVGVGGSFCMGFVVLILRKHDFQWNKTRQARD